MQHNGYPHRGGARVAGGQRLVGPNIDTAKQVLDIRPGNSFGLQLLGANLTVDECRGQQVLQVVVGLFLGRRCVLTPEAATPGDVVGGLKDLNLNRRDVAMRNVVVGGEGENRFDRRLRVDQCAELLQVGVLDDAEGRIIEPQIDGLAEELLKTVGALEDPTRSGDAALRERGRVHGALGGDTGRDSLPVGHRLGVDRRQRHVVCHRDGDGVGGLVGVQMQQLCGTGGNRDRQLQCMVEPVRHHRNRRREPALHLIRDGQGQQEVRASRRDAFRDRQHRAEVVRRMT